MVYRLSNQIKQRKTPLLDWLHVGLEKNITSEALKNFSRDCSEQHYQLIDLVKKTRNIANNFIQLIEKFPSVKIMKSEGNVLLEQEKIYEALVHTVSKLDVTYCAMLPTKTLLDVISVEEPAKAPNLS